VCGRRRFQRRVKKKMRRTSTQKKSQEGGIYIRRELKRNATNRKSQREVHKHTNSGKQRMGLAGGDVVVKTN